MITIIAITIASASLIFSLIQWISRHRPYIGIVDLKWDTISEEHVFSGIAYPDVVRCTIKNVGEAPAKAICLTGKTKAMSPMSASTEKITGPRELGILFPGQKMEVLLSFEIDSHDVASGFVNGDGVVEIDSLLSYKGTLLLRWHKAYETKQKYVIFQSPTYWMTLAGGDYR